MKKILSLFLVLAMIVSMLTIPTLAEGEEVPELTAPGATLTTYDDIDGDIENDATVKVGGVPYTVIREASQFKAMASSGKYILANDITLPQVTGNYVTGATNGFVLDGNGHTVTVEFWLSAGGGQGLFATPATNSTTTIQNIKFEMSGTLKQNAVGGLFGTSASCESGSINFTNVLINSNGVKLDYNASQGAALFISKPRMAIHFTNCEVTGTFTSTATATTHGAGVFVSEVDTASNRTMTFVGCKVSGTYNFQSGAYQAIFVAKVNTSTVTVEIDNCSVVDATINHTGTQFGVYVGCINAAKNVKISNCTLEYDFTSKASQTGAFVGAYKAPLTLENCHLVGDLTLSGSKNAGLVGYGNSALTFIDCSFTGSMTATSNQTGGFIGCIDNPGTVVLTGCNVNATVVVKNANRISPFIGQVFSSGKTTVEGEDSQQTAYYKDCTVSGTYVSNNYWNGAFMGVAIGSYNGTPQSGTVTFDNCYNNMFMVGNDSVSAYVGANGGGTAKLFFKNCESDAVIYSLGSAGAWIAEIDDANGNSSELTVNNCTNNGTIYAATVYGEDATVSAEALADGSYAYAVNAALNAKIEGFTIGQEIGVDAAPKFDGATVYEIDTKMAETFYSNTIKGVYTVDKGDGNATAYSQVAKNGDKYNSRIIISVATAELEKVAAMEITLTYNLIDGSTKTFTVNKDQVSAYYSVYADDMVAEAADGYLLLAIVVKNIPNDVWSGNEADVVVGMTATDAEGAPIAAYTIGA